MVATFVIVTLWTLGPRAPSLAGALGSGSLSVTSNYRHVSIWGLGRLYETEYELFGYRGH